MINPCSVSCRAVISYSLSYDAWGASTYLALKHATALVNKHKLTDFQGISLCNRIIDQRKYHSHVTEDSTAHIWIAPEKFTEQEEQVIKAYYMRQLLGRKILHARSKDFRKRSKESDTTLWLLQEGMRSCTPCPSTKENVSRACTFWLPVHLKPVPSPKVGLLPS